MNEATPSSFQDNLLSELAYLYGNAIDECKEFSAQCSQNDLSPREVLRAHFCIADHFARAGEGIGGFGPKNIGLLLSAISRQNVGFGSISKWVTVHDKAATLLFGLIMNHLFHDANK